MGFGGGGALAVGQVATAISNGEGRRGAHMQEATDFGNGGCS
jgi:hypothetical protein